MRGVAGAAAIEISMSVCAASSELTNVNAMDDARQEPTRTRASESIRTVMTRSCSVQPVEERPDVGSDGVRLNRVPPLARAISDGQPVGAGAIAHATGKRSGGRHVARVLTFPVIPAHLSHRGRDQRVL